MRMPSARRLLPRLGVCPAPVSGRRGSSRAAGVWPPPPPRPAGAFTSARTSSRRGTRGREARSCDWLTWIAARLALRNSGRERSLLPGCAGRISGKRVVGGLGYPRKEVGWDQPLEFPAAASLEKGKGPRRSCTGWMLPGCGRGTMGLPSKVSVVWSSGLLSRQDFGIFPRFLLQECCSWVSIRGFLLLVVVVVCFSLKRQWVGGLGST